MSEALSSLQRWFVDAMTQPHDAPPATSATTADTIKPSARLPAQARLAIYHSAYHARLIECLVDDYPALQHALGRDAFRALCLAYIARYPSRSPSLNGFGVHMAAFCAERDMPHRDFAAELAELEWSIIDVIHAAAGPALPAETLSTLTPEQFGRVRLTVCPSVRLLQHVYPVQAYYNAFRHGDAGPVPSAPPSRSHTLLRRQGPRVLHEALEPVRAALLRLLIAGEPISAALSAAADSGATPELIQGAFAFTFSSGLFVAVALDRLGT